VDDDILLSTRRLRKSFKGYVAVDGVDLCVRRGSIHALIGPNGAGKTTCFNLLTKFLQPSGGQILFQGADITRDTPVQVARRGIVRSFQISAVFAHLSVLENVRVALQRELPAYRFWPSGRALNALDDRAFALLAEVGLDRYAAMPAGELSYGRKRALELATTLALQPVLMLLDEPTQGMGVEDVDLVRRLIRKVATGRTVLMVEHNMGVVASLADRITVLARGAVLAEGDYAEVSRDRRVMEAYMGRTKDSSMEAAA